jgi:tetratricopeptide (TPR) repeat protein
MEAPAWEALAGIRFGRGDDEGALAAVERAVELARQIDDPQAVFPTLAYAANLFARLGRGGESAAFIEELRRARTERGRRELAAEWAYDLGVAMTTLDRSQEFLDGSEELGPPTRWLDAGCAVAAGDPLAAAEILAEIGSSAKEADARLWAAEVLIEEGKRSQADRQLNLVLEFAHAAGATALTRMAEALLRETG